MTINRTPNAIRGPEIITTADIVMKKLCDKIIKGALPAGAQLKNAQLAEEFGTSITPIREALNKLEKMGLTEYKSRRGWFVKDIDIVEMREVYEIREVLERFAVKSICQQKGEVDLDYLEKIHEDYKRSLDTDNTDECVKLDLMFHTELINMANNRYAKTWMKQLRNIMHLCRSMEDYDMSNEVAYDEHQIIIDCLKRHDAIGAEKYIFNHIHYLFSEL